jgi:hypothetical protein
MREVGGFHQNLAASNAERGLWKCGLHCCAGTGSYCAVRRRPELDGYAAARRAISLPIGRCLASTALATPNSPPSPLTFPPTKDS